MAILVAGIAGATNLSIADEVSDKAAQELICRADRLAYPIRDGIPVMLEDEARQLPSDQEVP